VWEEMRCAHPCLYMSEADDGRGTRGIAITSCAEVGDGRTPREESTLRGRRLPKRRLGASTGAAEKTHGAWVTASRARRNVRQTRADILRDCAASAATHLRRIFRSGLRHSRRSGHYASSLWNVYQTQFFAPDERKRVALGDALTRSRARAREWRPSNREFSSHHLHAAPFSTM
jgi:hypothetical protein